MAKTVVETFTPEDFKPKFQVEYKDTNNEWIPAVGGWDDGGGFAVASQYESLGMARVAARYVSSGWDHHTRVVQES